MEELFGGLIFFYVILIIAIIGYTIYKKEKINQQIDDLANNVLEMTPEEFMKMRATSFGGRGRPSYALTKNFAGVTYYLINQKICIT